MQRDLVSWLPVQLYDDVKIPETILALVSQARSADMVTFSL